MNSSDKFFLLSIIAFTVALFTVAIAASLISENNDTMCEQKGGVLVKSPSGLLCIDKRSIIQYKKT